MNNSDEILLDYNLTGNAENTSVVPSLIVGKNSAGQYLITYSLLAESNDLDGTPYDNGPFESEFAESFDYKLFISQSFQNVFEDSDIWGVSFNQTLNIHFDQLPDNSGLIRVGQLNGSFSTFSSQPDAMAFAITYDAAQPNPADIYGDIWINVDHASPSNNNNSLWDVDGGGSDLITKGEFSWSVIHQEIAHSLGIDIINSNLDGIHGNNTTNEDTAKYTITSYQNHPEMYYDPVDRTGPHALGLQLYDIAALQEIYGANTDTRNENEGFDDGDANITGTTYKEGQGFGATASDAFVYTIWDGGGSTDTIDVSAYTDGAQIDLR